ncbi:hypothetical protein [Streptomyces bangladeshensis]
MSARSPENGAADRKKHSHGRRVGTDGVHRRLRPDRRHLRQPLRRREPVGPPTHNSGRANAWRVLCRACLKNPDKAHQLIVDDPRPWTGGDDGTASGPVRHLRGRTGPAPRPPSPSLADPDRRDRTPTEVRIRGAGGTMTSVGHAGTLRTVRTRPGEAVTLRDVVR